MKKNGCLSGNQHKAKYCSKWRNYTFLVIKEACCCKCKYKCITWISDSEQVEKAVLLSPSLHYFLFLQMDWRADEKWKPHPFYNVLSNLTISVWLPLSYFATLIYGEEKRFRRKINYCRDCIGFVFQDPPVPKLAFLLGNICSSYPLCYSPGFAAKFIKCKLDWCWVSKVECLWSDFRKGCITQTS